VIFSLLLIAATTTSTAAEPTAEEREAAALERIEAAASRIANAAEKMAGIKPPEKPGEAKPPETTDVQVTVGAGLIWLAGNSQSLVFSGNSAVQVKTENWIYSGKAAGAYGKTKPAGSMEPAKISALNAAASLRGDRRFTERVTGYVSVGIDADHVKNIKYRPNVEGGASVTWFEEKKEDFVTQSLRTDLGLRYAFEERYLFFPPCMPGMTCPGVDIDPDDKILAPRLGVAFRYAVNENLVFTEDLEVMPDVLATEGKEGTRVLLNSTSKIAIKLTKGLALGVALGLLYDTQPAAPEGVTVEKLDSALTVGLEVSF
jgi:hypothetical protein